MAKQNTNFRDILIEMEEKEGIPKEAILATLKEALTKALKKYLGKTKEDEINVSIEINEKTGAIEMERIKIVVEEVTDSNLEISLEKAQEEDPAFKIGEEYIETYIPDEDFSRIITKTVKEVFLEGIRILKKDALYEDYKNIEHEIVSGKVERIFGATAYVSLGEIEGIMPKSEEIKSERFKIKRGERYRFYVMSIKNNIKEVMILLSRRDEMFIRGLFKLEVPEIEDGIVEILHVVREPGERTKIAVKSNDPDVDPVGTCIGNRGARINIIVDELFGERIDVISWTDDIFENIKQALSPAQVEEITISDDGESATVVVPDFQLALAKGRDGHNVRLASELCDIEIELKTHEEVYGDGEETGETSKDEASNENVGSEANIPNENSYNEVHQEPEAEVKNEDEENIAETKEDEAEVDGESSSENQEESGDEPSQEENKE